MTDLLSSESTLTTIVEQIKAVAQERVNDVTLETNIVELGLDSLERLEIVARIEERFAIRIPENDLHEIETVAEIKQAIEERLAHKGEKEVIPPEYYQLDHLPEWVQLK